MKEVGEEKIGESNEEIEIESEEKERGEEIEINEDRLPSRAMAIHEHIRQDGEKEMERDAMALFWSAIAGRLVDGRLTPRQGHISCATGRGTRWIFT